LTCGKRELLTRHFRQSEEEFAISQPQRRGHVFERTAQGVCSVTAENLPEPTAALDPITQDRP
jgi:hypothetical protein